MPTTIYDVCGIGNAIVDILVSVDESFIAKHKLAKSTMTMIDEARAEELYAFMKQSDFKECSGGSVANTMAGLASLGGMPCFVGKTKQDAPGESFRYDMRTVGVHFETPAAASGKMRRRTVRAPLSAPAPSLRSSRPPARRPIRCGAACRRRCAAIRA